MDPKTSNWTAQVLSKEHILYYIQFKPFNGRAAYYYLRVEPLQEKALLHALKNLPSFDLKEYGSLVYSGYGDEAPDHVKEWVQQWHKTAI